MPKKKYNSIHVGDVHMKDVQMKDILYKLLFHPDKVIKDLRADLKITQSELARMLSVQTMTVSAWERGATPPSDDNRKKILKIINKKRSK